MEELYLLLAERGANIDTISYRLADLIRTLQDKAKDGKITQFAKTQEGLEFSRFINQMKRTEKVRLIKENEMIDIVYGIKNFDMTQSHRFQEISHEIMRKIRKDFVYHKVKDAHYIKDLATLYLQFFNYTDMKAKVEDLKRVYVDHKVRGLPIVSVLAKWLIELSRDYFKDILNNFIKEYEVLNPPPVPKIDKIEKMPQKTTTLTSPKGGRVLKTSKEPKGPESTDTERPPLQESQSAVNLTKKQPVKKPLEPGDNASNLRIDKITPSIKSYLTDTSSVPDTLTVASIQPRQTPSTVAASPMTTLNTTPSSKQLDSVIVPAAPVVKKRSPFIQVNVNLSGQNAAKNYECLEDLDPSCTVMLNQLVGVNKSIKKLKGKNMLTIDTDKKREAITQTYKALFMQNSGAEKVISTYQVKSWQYANIEMPTSKKGDGFLEDYTVEYFERFYQNLNQTPRYESLLRPKPKPKKEKAKGMKAIYNNPLEIKRPLTGSLLRRARSNGSAHPLAPMMNESHAQSETGENKAVQNNPPKAEQPLSGKENRFASKIEAIMSESNSENYFRILKISNFLHKVPPKNQKSLTDTDKVATDPSFSVPHITEMLTENFSNLAASIPSQDKMSPKGKKLAQLGPYLKKLMTDEDELSGGETNTHSNTNMSASICKIKAGRLLMQPDQSKRTPVEFEKQFSLDQLIVKDAKEAKEKANDYNLFKGSVEASKLKNISKTRGIPAEPDYVLKGGKIFKEKPYDSEMYNFKGSARGNNNEPSLKIFISFEREVKEDLEKKRRDTEGDSDYKSEVVNGRKSHKHRKLLKTNQGNSAKNVYNE